MGFYTITLAVVGGACLSTGRFHLFIGLRRLGTDVKHIPPLACSPWPTAARG
jgi:hypothetical protein